ncbi:winged helix-turn-helix transcriptional regulator [Micromonospora sp. NPDC049282]|uniref:winged helix-turn-helix transcriptional regulator n=1 Tax=Micromonospora sp. NPDC049282 TaxID=3364269 RepID=UPI00371D02DF
MTSAASRDTAADPIDELIIDVFNRACPSRQAMETVADKWGTLALVALTEGAYRFNALRRRVDGVSEKMLARTLQALERDGLVTRDVQATIPPRVEYTLTAPGTRIAAALRALLDALEAEIPAIMTAREDYDQRH